MGEILNSVRAQVLVDALPYIQKYNNKILVVKYGGNAMTNNELKQAVMDDIVLLSLVGVKVVLVHGGGPEISDMLKRLNIESKFIGGLRYTDEAAVDVVKMVLSGKVNKELVSLLTRTRGKALYVRHRRAYADRRAQAGSQRRRSGLCGRYRKGQRAAHPGCAEQRLYSGNCYGGD